MQTPLFFLPGAGADPEFWKPVADLLPNQSPQKFFGWPGIGHQPSRANINSIQDLIHLVEESLPDEPVDLLAQSMGGYIALQLALNHPLKIRKIVLTATALGLNLQKFGARDWRQEYSQEYPNSADWVMRERPDISARLSQIIQPILLLWGDCDGISPLAVGEFLAGQLPQASLQIITGGDHDFVITHSQIVAQKIQGFLCE